MRCAVVGCKKNNKEKNVKFHAFTFPKCKNIRAKWKKFCRKGQFNEEYAVICEDHITKDDFSNNMEFEMGFAKLRKLKAEACPSLLTNDETAVSVSQRTQRKEARERKEVEAVLLKETEVVELNAPLEIDEVSLEGRNNDSCVTNAAENEEIKLLKSQMDKLQQENNRLRKESSLKSETIKNNLMPEISHLKTKLQKSELESSNMEKKLRTIFTSGQVKKLQTGIKRPRWTEEDIAKSITLYSSGAKTYKLLRRTDFPLPSIRTLRRWSQK